MAAALYEVRILLAPFLGRESSAEIPVRIAAHLAYALHNDARSLLHGDSIQLEATLKRIEAIDQIVGVETKLVERLFSHCGNTDA